MLTDWRNQILRFGNLCSHSFVLIIVLSLIMRQVCLFSQLTSQRAHCTVYRPQIIFIELWAIFLQTGIALSCFNRIEIRHPCFCPDQGINGSGSSSRFFSVLQSEQEALTTSSEYLELKWVPDCYEMQWWWSAALQYTAVQLRCRQPSTSSEYLTLSDQCVYLHHYRKDHKPDLL